MRDGQQRQQPHHGAHLQSLRAAVRLGPGKPDPARFLAAAYLEIWPALSQEKRDAARRLLARVFAEPEGFNRLIRPWLDAAADREEALSLVPDDPEDWERLEAIYAERRDWDGFRAAHERWDVTLRARLAQDLAAAGARLLEGDADGARTDFLSVALRARPDVRYADLLSDPIGEGIRVLEAAGVEVTPTVRAGMTEWVETNKREDRAPHKYALEDFGLLRSDVEQRFAAYRAAFLERT